MNKIKSYSGIDYFRLIAALLIVAVHTSPLASLSETGDFILTRIAARVAVPFFFMTSGFFLVSKYTCNTGKLRTFVKKTALIYGTAVLIYIPINIYSGYFKMDNLLPNIIKDIIFDGTFYHLWYLPASVMGAVTAWYLVTRFHYPKAFAISAVLYIIGLFGDSWYKIAARVPFINNFYRLIFQVSDYTRNGIFFAPIFFVLGGFISDSRSMRQKDALVKSAPAKNVSAKNAPAQNTSLFRKSIIGFTVSFAFMICEALTLHHFDLQRHDSMYIFLLPTMYYLFNIILNFKGKRRTGLRTISLIIYIIHPFMIVAVRFAAKLLNLQNLLIENSLVHYFAVCLISALAGLVITELMGRLANGRIQQKRQNIYAERAYLEINLDNLEHNVNVLQNAMPSGCKLMAVVKAEAYGHGMYEIAVHINRLGVNAFAVATIDEGIRLRKYGILGEILILGYTPPARAKELRKYNLTQTLIDYKYALILNRQGYHVKAHIKIDTGMHRLGFDKDDMEKILSVFSMKYIKTEGIYTHLCAADNLDKNDVDFTNKQIDSFYELLASLTKRGVHIPKVHIQSSYGLMNYPGLKCDYVRVGIAMYGVLSSPECKHRQQLDLKPVLLLKSKIILLRAVKAGESVGYNRAFSADRDSLIAVLPIGYADGYPRNLSCGKSYVLINGHKAPVVGKICMDQLTVDVTDISNVKVGAAATLIGSDGEEEISAPEVAGNSESITNELLSRMGRRLEIIAK